MALRAVFCDKIPSAALTRAPSIDRKFVGRRFAPRCQRTELCTRTVSFTHDGSQRSRTAGRRYAPVLLHHTGLDWAREPKGMYSLEL